MKNYVNSQATGRKFLIFLCTLDPNKINYFSALFQLYEIFKILQIQKRIVSAETIRANMVQFRKCFQKC